MARIKYYYDTEKCKYERIETKITDVILNILGFISLVLIVSVIGIFLYPKFFPSWRELKLQRENHILINVVNNELTSMSKDIEDMREREENIYRMITETDSIPDVLRSKKEDAVNKYRKLINKGITHEEIIKKKLAQVTEISYKIRKQDASYNIIVEQAAQKDSMLASIPAIQPVSNKTLKRLSSGFGWRTHPIYKVRKFHYGVDFAAPVGTPIYSTGDGFIEKVKKSAGGYGKEVVVNHGFGYRTRYAHMSKIEVKVGQKIKRGEQIGKVGNTGASTAPHLHYEVLRNGKPVNPVHFFFNDLNAEQYEEILKRASIENQSLS